MWFEYTIRVCKMTDIITPAKANPVNKLVNTLKLSPKTPRFSRGIFGGNLKLKLDAIPTTLPKKITHIMEMIINIYLCSLIKFVFSVFYSALD